MLKEGTYSAWFNTSKGQGTGIVQVAAGKISGGDSILSYTGHYETQGDRFTATIRTRRHTAGHSSVFGLDDLTINLEGACGGVTFRCWGSAVEAPHLPFEATLLFSVPEDETQPPNSRPAPKFDPDRLPRPLSR